MRKITLFAITVIALLPFVLPARAQTPAPTPIGPIMAYVEVVTLNVRNAPNTTTGVVIDQINGGESYTVIGRNGNTSWLLLDVLGLPGWVDASFVTAPNAALAPIADPSAGSNNLPTTNVTATVNAPTVLNARDVPSAEIGRIVAQLNHDSSYNVVGRNDDSSWVRLNVNGLLAWVNTNFVDLVGDMNTVPVAFNEVRPEGGTITANVARLNVREEADANSDIVAVIIRGSTYPAIGRNTTGQWIQIDVDGTIGWVSRTYIAIPGGFTNIAALPLTTE